MTILNGTETTKVHNIRSKKLNSHTHIEIEKMVEEINKLKKGKTTRRDKISTKRSVDIRNPLDSTRGWYMERNGSPGTMEKRRVIKPIYKKRKQKTKKEHTKCMQWWKAQIGTRNEICTDTVAQRVEVLLIIYRVFLNERIHSSLLLRFFWDSLYILHHLQRQQQ